MSLDLSIRGPAALKEICKHVTHMMYDRGLISYVQKFGVILRNLEVEKSSIQRDVQPLLSQKPLDPTASTVQQKLTTANNKIDDLTALSDLYDKK